MEDSHRRPNVRELRKHAEYVAEHLSRIKQDTFVGRRFSNLIALCIVIATAVTLNEQGVTAIQTSAQAAQALRPVAGEFAFAVFAMGIVGTGLLAYRCSRARRRLRERAVRLARRALARLSPGAWLYLIIIAATGIGMAPVMSAFEIDPIRALVCGAPSSSAA